jgi:hypothetical protein
MVSGKGASAPVSETDVKPAAVNDDDDADEERLPADFLLLSAEEAKKLQSKIDQPAVQRKDPVSNEIIRVESCTDTDDVNQLKGSH